MNPLEYHLTRSTGSAANTLSTTPKLENTPKSERIKKESSPLLNSLPVNHDVFYEILSHLPGLQDLLRVSHVCKEWKQLIDKVPLTLIKQVEAKDIKADPRPRGDALNNLSWKERFLFIQAIESQNPRFFDSFNEVLKIFSAEKFSPKSKIPEIATLFSKFTTNDYYCLQFNDKASSQRAKAFWTKMDQIPASSFWLNYTTNEVPDDTTNSDVALGGCFFLKSDLKKVSQLFKKTMNNLDDISDANWSSRKDI